MEAHCSSEKLVECYRATYCQKSVFEMKRLYLLLKSTADYKEGNIKTNRTLTRRRPKLSHIIYIFCLP